MRILLNITIIFIISCLIVGLSYYGHGHVIVFISNYRLDFALTTLLFAIFMLFIILYYLIRLLANINKFITWISKTKNHSTLTTIGTKE